MAYLAGMLGVLGDVKERLDSLFCVSMGKL
jgi:hypothetical protein